MRKLLLIIAVFIANLLVTLIEKVSHNKVLYTSIINIILISLNGRIQRYIVRQTQTEKRIEVFGYDPLKNI